MKVQMIKIIKILKNKFQKVKMKKKIQQRMNLHLQVSQYLQQANLNHIRFHQKYHLIYHQKKMKEKNLLRKNNQKKYLKVKVQQLKRLRIHLKNWELEVCFILSGSNEKKNQNIFVNKIYILLNIFFFFFIIKINLLR